MKSEKKKKKFRKKEKTLNLATLNIKDAIKKEIARKGFKRKTNVFISR